MRSLPFLIAALALAGCSQTAPGEATATPSAPATIATTNATVEPVPGNPPASESAMPAKPADDDASLAGCGAEKAKAFIGRQDRPTTRADLARLVGHDNIRWLGPDDAMTMDYSEDRLNVMLDAQKRNITGVKCG
jgi:hypothetical protein